MIRVRFHAGNGDSGDAGYSRYDILDSTLASNRPLELLSAFSAGTGDVPDFIPPRSESTLAPPPGCDPRQPVFSGTATVHGHDIGLRWQRKPDHVVLEPGGDTVMRIDTLAGAFDVTPPPDPGDTLGEQLLLGPGMVFLGPARNTWFLHASAVALSRGVVILAGRSGGGKSTLARLLPGLLPDCKRVADDIVALRSGAGTVACLPRCPQPRLAPADQPAGFPVTLPVLAVLLLEADPDPATEPAMLVKSGQAAMAVGLVNHAMGSGLGDRVIDRGLLGMAARLLGDAAFGVLRYPHHAEAPGQAAELIAGLLQNAGAPGE